MEFREMTSEDAAFVAKHSISGTMLDKRPAAVDYSFTLAHEGNILGVGGIQLIIPGTAWAWVDITSFGIPHIKTGYRVISEWMESLVKQHKIHRLQAYVDLAVIPAIRLVEHLGFTRESIMWDFLGDKPAAMYIKIYRDGV